MTDTGFDEMKLGIVESADVMYESSDVTTADPTESSTDGLCRS